MAIHASIAMICCIAWSMHSALNGAELIVLQTSLKDIVKTDALQRLYKQAHAIVPDNEQKFLSWDTATKLLAIMQIDLPAILDMRMYTFNSPWSGKPNDFYTYAPPGNLWWLLAHSRRHTSLKHDEIRTDELNDRVQEYKIHLMPYKRDIPEILSIFVQELLGNNKFRENIATFKFNIMQPSLKAPATIPTAATPTIVIYPQPSKENAQFVLNEIYRLFKGYKGTGIKPRWNAKVTDLIWWAQGDGDSKKITNIRKGYFVEGDDQGNGAEVFQANITGRDEDYWLKNPATGAN